jgi:hypothetical protein
LTIAITLHTWAQLCEHGDFDTSAFPADTPVRKFFGTSGAVVSSTTLKNPDAPPCMTGGGCGGGMCGL